MTATRTSALILIIIAAAASRLLPHPPNVTSITAIALFGGALFASRWVAFAVPMLALALSNLVLGLYWSWSIMAWQPHLWVQYVAFAFVVALGFLLRERRSAWRVAGVTFASSVVFFIVTNLGEWAFQAWYPKTWEGLVACFIAAIPFFRNSLIGDFGFVVLLFGGLRLLEMRFASLRAPRASGAATV
jgi:hypothetical protein